MIEGGLDRDRLAAAKLAYTTRRVPLERMRRLDPGRDGDPPSAGDLVLARVEQLGHHHRLESRQGRRAHMFVGDEIIVCYADRYAPDMFEAEVPPDLGPCDLVAAGGVAARMLSSHSAAGEPTRILPIGFVCDGDGMRLNLTDWRLPAIDPPAVHPPIYAVVGTSMNSGKTTMAVNLIRGLTAHGLRVGAAKLTGTGAGPDTWRLVDAGAVPGLDFIDGGLASTYKAPVDVIDRTSRLLRDHLAASGASAI